jgi:hypothetical protein
MLLQYFKSGGPDAKPVFLICKNSQLCGGKFESVSKFSYRSCCSIFRMHWLLLPTGCIILCVDDANYLREYTFFNNR